MIPGSTEDARRKQEGYRARGNWSVEQDEALAAAVAKYGARNWRAIAAMVPGDRTHVQCLQRWNKILKPGLIKGRWTEEEDAKLSAAVGQEPSGNWVGVAKYIPGRTAKQCRERWHLCLDPAISRDAWTLAEDDRLMALHAIHGNAWAAIAKEMPGRTENAVKSHFKSIERHRHREWSEAEDEIIRTAIRERRAWSSLVEDKLLPGRSERAVKTRWKHLNSTSPSTHRTIPSSSSSSSSSTTTTASNSTSSSPQISVASTPSNHGGAAPSKFMLPVSTSSIYNHSSTWNGIKVLNAAAAEVSTTPPNASSSRTLVKVPTAFSLDSTADRGAT